jgi:hypothetical protein
MTSFISFARRTNRDFSVDSICTKCYQTIASAQTANELVAAEEKHVCDPNGEFVQHHAISQRDAS